MIIKLKDKDTLILGDFKFKCAIGKRGLNKKKIEGDFSTPKGIFTFGSLFWRNDRVNKPETKLKCRPLNKNIGWCNDIKSRFYNKEVLISAKVRKERLFRKDYKYNYLLVINYNSKNIIKNKGSAIFLHITKNFKKTAGCIAVKENDFLVISKLLNKNSRISLS